MKVTIKNGVIYYTELTEAQWAAGKAWIEVRPINFEVWDHDHSKLAVHNPTPEQAEDLLEVFEAAE